MSETSAESFPSVEAYRDAVVEAARWRLLAMPDPALDALQDLLAPKPGTDDRSLR